MFRKFFINAKLVSIITTPIIFTSFFFGINSFSKKLLAETNIYPATYEELARYEWMGISYVCISREMKFNGIFWSKQRFPFENALSVATSTFVNSILAHHGGQIENNGEVFEIDPNRLYENASFLILAGAIQYCPDLVPKKSKDQFDEINSILLEELEELDIQNNQ